MQMRLGWEAEERAAHASNPKKRGATLPFDDLIFLYSVRSITSNSF